MNFKGLFISILAFIMLLSTSGCDKKAAGPSAADEKYIVHQGQLFEDSGWIYYCNPDDNYNLYKKSLNSSDNIKILEWALWPFCLDGEWIYSRDVSDNFSLYRTKTDGSVREKLNNGGGSRINVGREWIYYVNSPEGGICKVKKNGTGRTKLLDETPFSIYVAEGDGIYYYSTQDNSIYRIEMDGSKKAKITQGVSGFYSVSDGWVYYVALTTDEVNYPKIYKIRKDGTENTLLAEGKPYEELADFKLFGDYIYYNTYNSDNALYRVKIDGTGHTRISTEGEHIETMNVSKDGLLFKSIFYDSILCKIDVDSKKETVIDNPQVNDKKHLVEWLLYKDLDNSLGFKADKAEISSDYEPFTGYISEVKLTVDTAYFLVKSGDYNNLYKLDSKNPEPKLLAEGHIFSFDVSGNLIYYSDSGSHTIYSIKPDGTGKKVVAKKGADHLIVRDDWIYLTFNNTGIYRMKTNGSNGGFLVQSSHMNTFGIYDDWIYYPDAGGLSRIKTDGTENTKLFDTEHSINDILSVKDGRIYYENTTGIGPSYDWIRGLYSVKLDGTDSQTLIEGTFNPLFVDDGSIYYSKVLRDINIIKAKHDGTERKIVVPDLKWSIPPGGV